MQFLRLQPGVSSIYSPNGEPTLQHIKAYQKQLQWWDETTMLCLESRRPGTQRAWPPKSSHHILSYSARDIYVPRLRSSYTPHLYPIAVTPIPLFSCDHPSYHKRIGVLPQKPPFTASVRVQTYLSPPVPTSATSLVMSTNFPIHKTFIPTYGFISPKPVALPIQPSSYPLLVILFHQVSSKL